MWIKITPKLNSGVQLINSLDKQTFVKLLSHLSNYQPKATLTEELQTLQKSTKLTDETFQLLVQTTYYIFKQSNEVILKPTALQKQLCDDLTFEHDKAEEFVRFWAAQMNSDFGDFESRMKLKNVGWELNVQSASQICNKEKLPMARVQFNLVKSSDEKEDSVTVELDKSELVQFYNTLENIQMKLDAI